MYVPSAFAQDDPQAIAEFVAAFPLGLLVRADEEHGFAADPLPFLFDAAPDGAGTLRAHAARANPMWHALDDARVLVVFAGPGGYVSPSWYPSKASDPRVVPTWNYATVQARGRARVVHDAGTLRDWVTELTGVHERGRPEPWSPDDAPREFVDRLLGAIVGIEVRVDAWIGKWKLSQNRRVEDHDGVAAAFAAASGTAGDANGVLAAGWLARTMKARGAP